MHLVRQIASLGLVSGLGLMAIACDAAPFASEPAVVVDPAEGSTESTEVSTSSSGSPIPPIEGTYTINGTNPSGSEYEGTMTISRETGKFYTVDWQIGEQEFQGLGLLEAQSLSVGWGDASCLVVAYEVADQTLGKGRWFVLGEEEIGTEHVTRTKGRSDGIDGTYGVKGRNPDGSQYEGTLAVTAQDQSYRFAWQVGEDNFEGVGIQAGETVAVGWGQGNCSVAVYEVNPEGQLTGLWSTEGGKALGIETAIPIQE
ncbi:MAG: hypothetical protein AAGH78_09665 [Cyanobacteria bacterium P01_H01_bin.58]